MFGNLSIRPRMVALVAVPVAGTALLGATGVAGAWGDRARTAEERREAALAGQALAAVHELQLLEDLARDEADPQRRQGWSGSTTSPPGCAAPPRPCWP